MSEQIITGLLALVGALGGTLLGGWISGLYSIKAAEVGFEKETMKKKIEYLAKQAKSLYILEQEYLSEINKLNNNTPPRDTIKKNARLAVKNKGYEKITITDNKADEILQKYK